MKNLKRKSISLCLILAMVLTPVNAFASEMDGTEEIESTQIQDTEDTSSVGDTSSADAPAVELNGSYSGDDKKQEEANKQEEADDNVVIESNDKPYLALGADLSDEQRNTVLGLMGIAPENLGNYDVSYVTNQEEHQYLDAYIATSEIGSKSWSSVVIVKRDKGNGINLSTKNINYCTVGMYKNALVTAGIADADIIVAGPQMISGTAALVGIFKAYTDMTGNELSKENIDTSLNELVLTGKLESATGAGSEEIESMVAYLKQKVAEGALEDENSISQAIDDACKQFDVSLSDEEKSQLIDLLLKIKDLDLDVDTLLNQAQTIYDKLSDWGIDTSSGSGIGAAIKNFFSNIIDTVKNFFAGLFS